MFFKLFLLFTAIPIVELYILIEAGRIIGTLNTIFIIFMTGSVGAYLAKNQGFLVVGKIQEAFKEGRPPGRELLHGLFVLLGGFSLLTPGFISDLVGLSMLFPPIREIYINLTELFIMRQRQRGHWNSY